MSRDSRPPARQDAGRDEDLKPKSGRRPQVIVCAGGGGVGKTTTSAAIALALAWQGKRTLVITVDPARRLADAMETPIGSEPKRVPLPPTVTGELWALMPDPRVAMRTFIEHLFKDEPEAKERLLKNRIFLVMEEAVAGVHELVSVMLVVRAVSEIALDFVVVDTAPSRYALDLVSYPGRLASLLEGRAVAWFGSLAQRASGDDDAGASSGGGMLAWGRRRVEGALGRALGARVITDVADLFGELARVRVRFAHLARQAEDLVLGEATKFVLVAAPSGAAGADLHYLARKLEKLERRATAVVLNRADTAAPAWVAALSGHEATTPALIAAIRQLEDERSARTRAADAMAAELRQKLPALRQLRLPTIAAEHPAAIVNALATALASQLSVFGV
jgi:anion-transporting  ArsA/GET3 family ATPase